MPAEYQFYHGAVLHELLLQLGAPLRVELKDIHGRPDAYLIQDSVGVLIKHSAKRLTPWTFTFTTDHLQEVEALCAHAQKVFVSLVCGDDGITTVPIHDLIEVLDSKASDQAWIRVERRPGEMYRVSGAKGEVRYKLARGVDALVAALKS